MKTYAEYDFYVEEFGDMPAEEFKKYIRDASVYLRRITIKKSDTYTGDELKYAACSIAELFREVDGTCRGGRLIQSENNDGFSVSFAAGATDPESVKNQKAYAIARDYLSGTGLLDRRVECVCRR